MSRYWDIISEAWKESGEENIPSPLVVAADQLAQAAGLAMGVNFEADQKLKTALANYKRVREG
jgi:hypothetical protein